MLMALLAPFCVLCARGRAFARVARFSSSRGWLGGWWRSQPSLAQHADRMARFADLLRLPGSCCQLSTKACRHPRLGNATPKRKVCRKVHTSTFHLIFDPGKKRCRESEGLWKFALLQLVSRLACWVEYTLSLSAHIPLHTRALFDNCCCSGRLFRAFPAHARYLKQHLKHCTIASRCPDRWLLILAPHRTEPHRHIPLHPPALFANCRRSGRFFEPFPRMLGI